MSTDTNMDPQPECATSTEQVTNHINLLHQQLQQQSEHIREQRQMILQLNEQLKSYTASPPSNPQPQSHKKQKEALPVLEKFHGKRENWDEWHLGAIHKLNKDGEAIGDGFDQFMYLYSRLAGSASKMVSTVAKKLSEDGIGDGEQFLEYLNTVFGDPNKKARAQQELLNIKQANGESFAAFLPRFETLLANAGWSSYSDEHKMSFLKNALNKSIKTRLVGIDPIRTWSAFVSRVHNISSDLIALNHPYIPHYAPTKHQAESRQMDWEPASSATINNMETNNVKRAAWVSKEVLEQRRKRDLCVRCGHKGHRSKKCSFLPPLKPKLTTLNTAQMTEDEEEEDEDGWELTKPEGMENKKGKEKLL